ncbi:unnamed protein product [Heterobilharzia americana]|nr:unnamed protein product [Heterobilharzia americana]
MYHTRHQLSAVNSVQGWRHCLFAYRRFVLTANFDEPYEVIDSGESMIADVTVCCRTLWKHNTYCPSASRT